MSAIMVADCPVNETSRNEQRAQDHFVQFYEDDAFLIQSVLGFIDDALLNGAAVVIATASHCELLADQLQQRGHDVIELTGTRRLVMRDARATMSAFMRDGTPDPVLFRATVGTLMRDAAARGRVRAFGEMVALLWADGAAEAALQLERLWNTLHRDTRFSLLCAYPIATFADDTDGAAFNHVCEAHHCVIPAESYANYADAQARMRAIAGLQQQSHALMRERALRHDAERSAQALRVRDALTGLINRTALRTQLQAALVYASTANESVALLHIDVDRFQRINDAFGHLVGDQLLEVLARRLNNSVRGYDIVARLSGAGFAVLLAMDGTEACALQLADRIRGSLSRPIAIEGHSIVITVSIGIAVCPADGMDADHLLVAADLAVHAAKEQGSSGCRRFSIELQRDLQASLTLEERLRDALVRDEFKLVYQPVYELQSGSIRAVEALVRWQPPDGSVVSPTTFIPVAEAHGLIVPLGNWILRSACHDGRRWLDCGFSNLKVLINLSVVQLEHPDLIAEVTAVAAQTGFPLTNLVFEITESIFLHDAQKTNARLAAIRALGIEISLDDFGTGYSCLSYLRRLPLDKLKIDRSFVKDIAGNASDAAIVAAILTMGRALNLDVVAEGVETSEQLRILQGLKCPSVQGFLLSRPVGAEQISDLLGQSLQIAADGPIS